MRKVKIINIRKGKAGRDKFTYANLVDVETGENLVSATLEYIVAVCADTGRELELTNAIEVLQQVFPYDRIA